MKLAKVANLLALGAILTLSAIGCRKGLDKTTHIPKGSTTNPTVASDSPAPALGPGQGITGNPTDNTGISGVGTVPPGAAGLEATGKNFDGWVENREEFKAQTVYFDYDKSNIKPGEVSKLEEVARRMKSSFAGKALRIEGHCDERGTEEYNRALGDKRALSGREKLAQLGMDPSMIPTVTFGEERPAELGHDEAAFKKNRRIELILLSPPGATN